MTDDCACRVSQKRYNLNRDCLTVRQVVVDRIVFGRELRKEQLGQIRQPWLLVLETLGHLSQLALDLDHPVQDQMGEDHQRIFLDDKVLIREAFVEFVAVLVNDTAKGDSDVAERDDDVTADARVSRGLENLEQEVVVLVTELRANAEEFGKRQRCRRTEGLVLPI